MDDALVELMARALDPELWAKIDKYADDDDWNGATAVNARDLSMRNTRRTLAAINASGYAVVPAGDILALADAGVRIRAAIQESDSAFSAAGVLASRLTAAREEQED